MSAPKLPSSQRRSIQWGLRIEAWLKRELDEIARRQERTVAQLARMALREYVEREKKKAAA
jgi:predicted transcriptional regulator